MPTTKIAICVALMAFCTAILSGAAAGNGIATILSRGIVSLWGGFFAGLVIGYVAQKAIDEKINQIKSEHPIKVDPESADDVIIAEPINPDGTRMTSNDVGTGETGQSNQPFDANRQAA